MSNRTVNISTSLSGNDPFLEIQGVNTDHFQFGANSVLALADNVNLTGNLTVNGALNGATIDGNGITIAQLNATTDVETPKIIFPDNAAAGLTVQATDGADYITLKSTNGQEQIQLNKTIFTNGNSLIHGSNNSRGTIQYSNLVNSTIAPSCTINANSTANSATATLLQNTRYIGGVAFNGSADIALPGVNQSGNQNTSGTAASWTSSRNTFFNSISSGNSQSLGTLALSGTGNTTLNLDIPAVDRSDDTSATIIIANTVSDNDESDFKHQLLFKNQHLSQGNSNSQNLTGGIFIEPLSQKHTIYNVGHSSQSQTTKFLYDGTYSHPTMNDFLKFQTDHATEGRHLELRASPVSANDTTTAERILPTGIKFFNDGEFSDNVNNGFMGGIQSFYAAEGHAQTRIFNRTNTNGSAVQHELLLYKDNILFQNIPTLTFQGTNGTIASGGDITLSPNAITDDINLEGAVKITGADAEPIYKYASSSASNAGINEILRANRPGEAITTASCHLYMTGAGNTSSDGANELIFRSTTGGMKLGFFTQTMKYYGSSHAFNGMIQGFNTGSSDLMRMYSSTNTAKYWGHSINTGFDYTISNTNGRDFIVNAGGDVKITSGDDILLTPTGNVGINQSAPDAELHVGTDHANANVKIKIAENSGSASRGINIGGFSGASNVSNARIQCTDNLHIDAPDGRSMFLNFYERGNIYALGSVHVASDERIKTNIEVLDDDEALEMVKQLETKKYTYIDKKTEKKRIGWIAQDVFKIMPDAVSFITNTIPNVFDTYNCSYNKVDGNLYKINIPDWVGEEGSTYRLIVNKFSDDNTFSLDGEYKNGCFEIEITNEAFNIDITTIFIYGKEIDDFHTIDKNQILATHHSAIQQLDRNDDKLEDKILLQDEKIVQQDEKIVSLEQTVRDLIARVSLNELALKSLL